MGNIVVRKANRVITVTENELDKYVANGYAIIEDRRQPKEVEPAPISKPIVKEKVAEKPEKPSFEEFKQQPRVQRKRNNKQ